jgi:hypothetical protein
VPEEDYMARGRSIDDISTLQMALVGFQIEKQKIEQKIQELQMQLKGKRAPLAGGIGDSSVPRKRELSEAARRRIAAAQKRRWAEHRRRAAQAAKAQKQASKAQAKATGASS